MRGWKRAAEQTFCKAGDVGKAHPRRQATAPVKAGLWAQTAWDRHCDADFTEYKPPTNARLTT